MSETNRHVYLTRLLRRSMAQPFHRAWDILKQGPYDHQNPNERPRGLYPPPLPSPSSPLPSPPLPSPNPYGEQPGDPQEQPNPYERIHPQPGPYNHTQRPQPYDTSSQQIAEIRAQIQQLEAELQQLYARREQMEGIHGFSPNDGGGHPWEK